MSTELEAAREEACQLALMVAKLNAQLDESRNAEQFFRDALFDLWEAVQRLPHESRPPSLVDMSQKVKRLLGLEEKP